MPQDGIGMDENKQTIKWIGQVAFVLLWLLLMVGGYFWAHKPFATSVITALGQSLFSIVAWLGLTLLGAALGYAVVRSALAEERPLTRFALGAGIGLGLIAIIMGIFGLVGLIHPLVAWGLVLLLAVLLRSQARQAVADLRTFHLPHTTDRFYRWIVWYGMVSLVLTFLLALAPVTAWDSLTYHLRGPQFYIEAGRIVHPVDIPHLGFPLVGQMLFTLGMLLVGDGVTPLLHFGYGLLALVLVIDLARRIFGTDAAWWSAMVYLSIPTLFTLMSWPYVDIALLFYATAAFYGFYRWTETRRDGWLVVIGFACGFAGGLKYTAVAIPIALAISLIWESRRDGLMPIIRRLAVIGILAGLLVVPWLVENWLTVGNPVYPFFFNHGLYWDEWRAWWYDRPGTGLLATSPWRLLFVPIEATVAGTEGSNFYEATIGPFILTALFFVPLVWRKFTSSERRWLLHLGLFFLINYFLWLNGVARTALLLRARFLFFAFGIAAVTGGAALARLATLTRPQLDVGWMVRTFTNITLAGLLFAYSLSFLQVNPLPAVVGLESASDYRGRQLGVYEPVMQRLNELPPGSRIVFLWETRSYACVKTIVCDPDPILDRFLHLTQYKGYQAAEIMAQWQAEGVTHVLLYQTGLDFLLEQGFDPITDADLAVLHDLQTNYWTPVQKWDNAYTLYAIQP